MEKLFSGKKILAEKEDSDGRNILHYAVIYGNLFLKSFKKI
jgi:hypothetical protein